jgi:hypothetical protein
MNYDKIAVIRSACFELPEITMEYAGEEQAAGKAG